ncbi:MAG: Holliday junction DNA helicase RuvB C-terminal domain-containing protein, partial [Rhabdochlamydiaceae bacterium]
VIHRLNFYQPDELEQIIQNAAIKLHVEIDQKSLQALAVRSRGTPRIALKLLKRVRDFSQVHGEGKITLPLTNQALAMLEVDVLGLDTMDTRYLDAIIKKHNGGPVGLQTIASTISEDIGTLEDMVEPYLLQIGFLQRTPRGRVATKYAYEHLGIVYPLDTNNEQQKLV